MNIESQVASLELSKRLHELGVTLHSFFWWRERTKPDYPKPLLYLHHEHEDIWLFESGQQYRPYDRDYHAYTVAELGLMLLLGVGYFTITHSKNSRYWRAGIDVHIDRKYTFFDCKTEADCRAKALIYCIEHGLVKIEDINNAKV